MPRLGIGIHGIGIHLPPHVRKNDAWPASFAEQFQERTKGDVTTQKFSAEHALAIEVVSRYQSDPFRGSVERRVLADELEASDMEVAAAKEALEMSNTRPEEIDLLIVSNNVPDYLGSGNASAVHHKLGLRKTVMSLNLDNVCNSLIPAMVLAGGQIQLGVAKKALLVQSAAFSRILDYDRPNSVNFGDGASAVVVGKVSEGRGVLGWSSFNDGSLHKAVCMSRQKGGRWYDGEGRIVAGTDDIEGAKRMLPLMGVWAKQAVEAALDDAKLERGDIDFFACHQPVAWLIDLCARTAGLTDVPTANRFAEVAGIGPANVPLHLDAGVRSGALKPGGLAMLYAMGSGTQWGSMALRWGS